MPVFYGPGSIDSDISCMIFKELFTVPDSGYQAGAGNM